MQKDNYSADSLQVNDMYADEQIVAVVHQSGLLALYKRKPPGSESLEDMFNIDCILSHHYDSPLKSVKVSSDSRYLIAYCESREQEDLHDHHD